MRLKTIVHPEVAKFKNYVPSFPHDYIAVPAVWTYGTFKFLDILSEGDRVALARFTNGLAKKGAVPSVKVA